jgi:nitrite reductase (cytochrome c-552)
MTVPTDPVPSAPPRAAPASPRPRGRGRALAFALVVAVLAAGTFGVLWLLGNISERKQEARAHFFRVVDLTEDTVDPAVWGRNFPRQYDGYRRTVDVERTRHGGSDAFSKLEADPRWKRLFDGYAFAVDYREERGHAYMLSDQEQTQRHQVSPQPGACLHCHSSVIPAYRKAGVAAGAPPGPEHAREQMMKGFEVVCAEPYAEARTRVDHPVTCLDCHDPTTNALRVTRPGFLNGIAALAASGAPLPHLASVERWRRGDRKTPYDANALATRQEMRSFACGQCHVEYYFKGPGKLLTYPWHKGLKVEEIEAYYDEVGHEDWSHAETGAPVLKAQHPEFELWSQGIHARNGVACADCHMPYQREGAIKVSDHHVRSPLLHVSRSCQVCHHVDEAEIRSRAEAIQDRTQALLSRGEDAVLALMDEIQESKKAGLDDEALKAVRALHRRAEWRLDFVAAENSLGFHAPQESARILAEAIDFARQGQAEAIRLRLKR